MTDATTPTSRYPGERLGLPESGPGSIAGVGRRLIGLALDWGVALGASALFAGGSSLWTLAIWCAHTILGLLIFGASFGHLVCGMHLRRVNGEPAGFWRPIVRQIALALIIPGLVWDTDHRGGHDILAGTVLRLR